MGCGEVGRRADGAAGGHGRGFICGRPQGVWRSVLHRGCSRMLADARTTGIANA
jgi:hypothetical protein